MAFTYQGERGNTGYKSSGPLVNTTVTADVSAGALVIVVAVSDNLLLGDVNYGPGSGYHTNCVDARGNTYYKIGETNRSDGVAADGVEISVWYSVLGTALVNGDGVSVLFNVPDEAVARAIGVWEFSISGSGVSLEENDGTYGTGTSPSTSLSGLTNQNYLLLHACGIENKSNVSISADADYTNVATEIGTGTAGAGTDNVAAQLEYRIATLTNDVVTGTISASSDYGTVMGALYETGLGPGPISESESITADDTPTVKLGNLLDSESESLTVSDTPLQRIGVTTIIAESTTVSDTPAASIGLTLSVAEGVTASSSSTLEGLEPSDPQIGGLESITASDSPVLEIVAAVNKTESITVSDTPSLNISGPIISLAESITVTSSSMGIPGILNSEVDSVTVSDSAKTEVGLLPGVSDSIGLSDLPWFYPEIIWVGDRLVSIKVVTPGLSEITLSESITVSDTSTLAISLAISVAEGVVVSETPVVSESLAVFVSEGAITVSDSVTVIEVVAAQVSETITASDTPTVILSSLAINVTEGAITVSDAATLDVGALPNVQITSADSVTVSDSITALIPILEIAETESLTVSSSASLSLPEIGALVISIAEVLNVSDSPASRPGIATSTSETITLADSATVRIGLLVVATETVDISDNATVTLTTLQLSISDGITVSDSPIAAILLSLTVTDSLNIAETANLLIALGPQLSESIIISDTPYAKLSDMILAISETINVSDTILANIPGFVAGNILVSETVGIADVNTVGIPLGVSVVETISLSDLIWTAFLAVMANMGLSDALVNRMSLADELVYDLTPTDALVAQVDLTDE